MKFRTSTATTAMALSAALAIPVGLRLAAQEQRHQQSPELQHYVITDLGTLGGTSSEAVGVNNRGWMAGSSRLAGDTVLHAALWEGAVQVDLGTLGGPNSVAPEAAPQPNERGDVAGASDTSTQDPNGEDFCFFGTHLICLPFVWEKGALTALSTLGGNNGEAFEINDRGQVVGTAENATADPTCSTFEPEAKPVIWENGVIQELPTVSGDLDGVASAINDRGQAVGVTGNCYSNFPLTSFHAVLWPGGSKGGVVDLGNLGGTAFNLAFGINRRGQVVGQSALPGNTASHAFLWQNGVMSDLGTLSGQWYSWAETINNKGQAVGTSFDFSSNMYPFIWENGVMTDLNKLIPPNSPWLLLEALGNNDRGQIVGYAYNYSTGEVHGYLLTPCGGADDSCGGTAGNAPVPTPAPPALNGHGMLDRFRARQFPGLHPLGHGTGPAN